MAKKTDAEDGDEGEKGGGKLRLVIMILPTVLLIIGALYVFVLHPSGGSASTGKPSASSSAKAGSTDEGGDGSGEEGQDPNAGFKPGKIITVEPITVNLANGHYLKVGVGLQATADAGEEVDTAKAIDALIAQFSGNTVTELSTKAGRDAAKKALSAVLRKAYEKKVYTLYWTTFVLQ